jgi:predicted transcriptional regulator
VTSALVTRRDVAIVVAASFLRLRLDQRRKRRAFVQIWIDDFDDGSAAW